MRLVRFLPFCRPLLGVALLCVFAAGCGGSSGANPPAPAPAPVATATPGPTLQSTIKNVIVIYQENWSFDALYGRFPGANGLNNASPANYGQIDKKSGAAITALPQPLKNGTPDSNFPPALPVQPYDAASYVPPTGLTGDMVHRFYQEQSQIDGGKMDEFVTWSDNGGLVLSYFDATSMPEGRLAAQYTLADNFFHSAFGGSFLNHQWLICACTPAFPGATASAIANVDASGKQLALDANANVVHDGFVTPDGFAVNTAFTVNNPHPAGEPAANLVPNQTNPTIGDRLSAANVTWKWYSGGWANALAGHADPPFAFHHQPFAYYAAYADGTAAKTAHLQDEAGFLADLHNGQLPAVSFVKPLGPDTEHPGSASLVQGQQHVATLIQAVQSSPYWTNAAIIITYDENGGRWDHVSPPPPPDRWGTGTRVPAIVVSPWAKRGFVDHTQYETVSILAFLEKLYGLRPLGTRDAAANPLTNAFDFTQINLFAAKRASTRK
jgi:phospholipase C